MTLTIAAAEHAISPPAEMTDKAGLTASAAAIAYAGALPLVIGAVLAWARPEDLAQAVLGAMAAYGAALLAFFGGVRWGVAVMGRSGPHFAPLIGAVIPLALGVGSAALPGLGAKFALLVVVLPLLLLDDLRATRRGSGAPAWYLGVRIPLTILMEAALLAGLVLSLR